MKRCFSTLCCLDATPEQAAAYAVANGMSGVEVRVNEKGETLGGCTVADAAGIRRLFAGAGLTVTDLALSCHIREYDAKQIETGKCGMDFAAAAGAGAVRVFVGAHQAKFSEPVVNDTAGIQKALKVLSDYGKEKNVALWLETHSSYSTGKAMRALTDSLKRDNIKVIWDVLHSLEYGESPEKTVAYLGSTIAHVHLKDGRPGEDRDATQFIHTDLGQGVVPIAAVLAALNKIRYNGFYSLEWEAPWRKEIQMLYPDTNALLAVYNRFLSCEIMPVGR